MTTPNASRKDRYGNRTYAIPHPETRELVDLPSWSRLRGLMHSGGLETWKLKLVASAVARSTALQMQAADPSTCYEAVKTALSDTEKADIGTMVHRYTEDIDAGTLDPEFLPAAAAPYVEHYRAAVERYGWQVAESEQTIYNFAHGYAGSADRFSAYPPDLLERLGVPDPEMNVLCSDVKTGKDVHAETALQLAAYANGEGIFVAPTKAQLGFDLREQGLQADIDAGRNVPPGRRKWSEAAIRDARAALENEWWEAYAAHGTHRAMPSRLRDDWGMVIHLTAETCELVPVRLGGEPRAFFVVVGLVDLYNWQRRDDVLLDPITEVSHGGVAGDSDGLADEHDLVAARHDPGGKQGIGGGSEAVPASSSVPSPADAAVADVRMQALADMPPLPAGWQPGQPATHWEQWCEVAGVGYRCALLCREWLQYVIDRLTPAQKSALVRVWPDCPTLKASTEHTAAQLDAIRRALETITGGDMIHAGDFIASPTDLVERLARTFGAEVQYGEEPADDALKQTYIAWLDDIAADRPHLLSELRPRLDGAGLHKKLRADPWTVGELRLWGRIVADVERANVAAHSTQKGTTE